jgi:hypothetical protein
MTSFNQLKQDLIDLTENNSSDFSSESPQFIDTAERRLARELINVPELYKHQNATLTIGDAFVTKPTDLITIISFQVLSSASARTALEYRDVGYINEYWPTRTSTSTPKYYADWDNDFYIIAPTPSAALTVEINYRTRFSSLSGSNTTNWLTDLRCFSYTKKDIKRQWQVLIKNLQLEGQTALRVNYGICSSRQSKRNNNNHRDRHP